MQKISCENTGHPLSKNSVSNLTYSQVVRFLELFALQQLNFPLVAQEFVKPWRAKEKLIHLGLKSIKSTIPAPSTAQCIIES